jgi:CheY-specific phosphatase CheX
LGADSNLSRQALEQAVLSVFKAMTGVSASVADPEGVAPFESPLVNARISFTGPCSGDIGLLIEPPLDGLIASHMLGIDPKEPLLQDMIDDAVKEMVNVVCGQFLTLTFGSRPVFSLGIPIVLSLGPKVCNSLLQGRTLSVFKAEGLTILGSVRVKET